MKTEYNSGNISCCHLANGFEIIASNCQYSCNCLQIIILFSHSCIRLFAQ